MRVVMRWRVVMRSAVVLGRRHMEMCVEINLDAVVAGYAAVDHTSLADLLADHDALGDDDVARDQAGLVQRAVPEYCEVVKKISFAVLS